LPYEVLFDEETRVTEVFYRHFFNYFYFSDHDGKNLFCYNNLTNLNIFRERKEFENQILKVKNGFQNFVLSDESYYIITEGLNRSLKTLYNFFIESFENGTYTKCLELVSDSIDVIDSDEVEFDPVVKNKLLQFEKIITGKINGHSSGYYTIKLS
jgi:hypothetical protein